MAPLPLVYTAVVVLDANFRSANKLADRFRTLGAQAFVVATSAAAITVVRNKRVDIVFVSYQQQSRELMSVLDQLAIPRITCATPADISNFADEVRNVMQLAVREQIATRRCPTDRPRSSNTRSSNAS